MKTIKIYYDTITEELLTEDEVNEKAKETVLNHRLYLDAFCFLSNQEIWDMLTEEAQETLISEAIEAEIDDCYPYREFNI